MDRELLTAIISKYATEYALYKIELMQSNVNATQQPKPPVNPVNTILEAFDKERATLEQQVAYWKRSFHKQVETTRATL